MSCGQCTRWHRRESRLDTSSGHMKRNGSMTRKHNIHKLKYIIHMSTKSCPRHALTRAFCATWLRGPVLNRHFAHFVVCGYVVTKSCHRQALRARCAMIRIGRFKEARDRRALRRKHHHSRMFILPSSTLVCRRREELAQDIKENLCCIKKRPTSSLTDTITTDVAIRLLSFQPSPTVKGCQQLPPFPFFSERHETLL